MPPRVIPSILLLIFPTIIYSISLNDSIQNENNDDFEMNEKALNESTDDLDELIRAAVIQKNVIDYPNFF